ncbi:Ankyrin repeat domain-containing protein 50 [Colletotrichum viniferum]|nr:Ankyrin repeat domain-containing protein 50 [Colletotrichum viniferum]
MMPTDDLEQPGPQAKRAHIDDSDDETGGFYPKRQRTSTENVKHGWWREPEQIKLSHADYTVGWICALPIELAASHAMLDKIHESLPTIDNDTNAYILGSIGDHNIAMACLPFGQYGTINAATVAGNMMRSFRSIRFGFMVGIGGGVPGDPDIRLGDIVVGTHVIQHDLGKIVAGDGFQGTATPKAPPQVLLTAISKLRAFHETNESRVSMFLEEMQQRYPRLAEYNYPSSCEDRLFLAAYDHGQSGDCSSCSRSQIHHRPSRSGKHPRIHYGGIASGDQVIKSARHRDELAKKHNIICYEMEAAGLSDNFSSIVIRGICDYADSHKNKEWQRYAAATAAAYAKELLSAIAASSSHGLSGNYSSPLPADIPRETLYARREALLESIRFEQIDARHATIKSAHSKTCDWLIQDPLYDKWLDQSSVAEHRGFFWISGKPGAGKSTIMKFAYNRAKQASKSDDAIISFFFNARGDELEKSTFGLYRSLLLQLLERFSDLQTVLDNTALISPRETGCPNTDSLQELLRNAIISLGQRRLTCFVDALDECDESQVRDMVVYFEDLGEDAVTNGTQLRICFSSRHYPHIDVRHGLRLVIEDQPGHGHDLERYVRSHLRTGTGKHVDNVRSKVLEKAGGVFMWVVLVCKILNEEFVRGRRAISRVEQRLREIPPGLSDLFKDILRRDNANMEDLLLCIQWVLFARRPLTLKEFYFAMCSGLPESQEYPTVCDPETQTEEDMRVLVTGSSKGLAEVTKSKKATIQFIHESVKDFLVKDGGFRELWPDLERNFEIAGHETLKHCCRSHITADVSRQLHLTDIENLPRASSEDAKKLRQDAVEKFPFLEYATENLFHHANFVAQRVSQEMFLQEVSLSEWIRLNNMLERYQNRRYTRRVSLTYILAEKNFCTLLEQHTRRVEDANVPGERYGYPFCAAIAHGNRHAAKLLLGKSAESIPIEKLFPNPEYHVGRTQPSRLDTNKYPVTPLHWAVKEKQWAIAGFLLDSGDVSYLARNKKGQSCIHLAAIGGNDSFMHRLLESSRPQQVHIDWPDKEQRTPLWYACHHQNEAIIRQLLLRGAQPSTFPREPAASPRLSLATAKLFVKEGFFSKTYLLESAVHHGLEEVLDYVLGDDKVCDLDTDEANLLENAAAGNHDAIVRLLLDRGAADGSRKWNSHDIVIRALFRNDANSVQYFVENGIDVVALVKQAYSHEDEHLIKMLVEAAPKGSRITHVALMYAAMRGQEALVKFMVAKGADVNPSVSGGRGPLHNAAGKGHKSVVEFLLTQGADVNSLGTENRSALHFGSQNGHRAVVKVLIAHGANIDQQDWSGETALYTAAQYGYVAVVEVLLEYKANVNIRDDTGQTTLHIASKAGREAVVKTLLTYGVDVNLRDAWGETALHKASAAGHETVVEVLLAHEAKMNLLNSSHQSALDVAVKAGHREVTGLLFDQPQVLLS